jgi:hypothetical protein
MLVLSYSVLEGLYYFGIGFKAGVELGTDAEMTLAKKKELMNMETIHLLPKNMSGVFFQDSIFNEKSGKYVPVSYGEMTVSVNSKPSIVGKVLSLLADIVYLIMVVWALVIFVLFIVSINKSDIFNWKNVHRLSRLGVLLIISFGCSLFKAFLTVYDVEKVFSLTNYSLCLTDMVSTTLLVVGLASLIIAQVFAIGLKMKEEQDLTI